MTLHTTVKVCDNQAMVLRGNMEPQARLLLQLRMWLTELQRDFNKASLELYRVETQSSTTCAVSNIFREQDLDNLKQGKQKIIDRFNEMLSLAENVLPFVRFSGLDYFQWEALI